MNSQPSRYAMCFGRVLAGSMLLLSAASGWSPDELEAALAHEQEHGKRKGAITAIESARTQKEGES